MVCCSGRVYFYAKMCHKLHIAWTLQLSQFIQVSFWRLIELSLNIFLSFYLEAVSGTAVEWLIWCAILLLKAVEGYGSNKFTSVWMPSELCILVCCLDVAASECSQQLLCCLSMSQYLVYAVRKVQVKCTSIVLRTGIQNVYLLKFPTLLLQGAIWPELCWKRR